MITLVVQPLHQITNIGTLSLRQTCIHPNSKLKYSIGAQARETELQDYSVHAHSNPLEGVLSSLHVLIIHTLCENLGYLFLTLAFDMQATATHF